MIIGISGKKGSGKDTFARVINTIVSNPHFTDEAVLGFIDREHNNNFKYKYKSFAEKIKQIVSLLTGYTLKQLENREIKESELGEEWWYWKLEREGGYGTSLYPYLEGHPKNITGTVFIKPTVRGLLQDIGTDLFRNRIHPNIWVTALFADYREQVDFDNNLPSNANWIITDVRFPNEMKAIQERDGIVVRIERKKNDLDNHNDCSISEDGYCIKNEDNYCTNKCEKEHTSETVLDDCKDFDIAIQNDGSLIDLVVKAREFIKKFKIK